MIGRSQVGGTARLPRDNDKEEGPDPVQQKQQTQPKVLTGHMTTC